MRRFCCMAGTLLLVFAHDAYADSIRHFNIQQATAGVGARETSGADASFALLRPGVQIFGGAALPASICALLL
jgi:hypothetical protein